MRKIILVLFALLLYNSVNSGQPVNKPKDDFLKLLEYDWKLVFYDSGKSNWENHWFLDGLRASVVNTPRGIVFSGGAVIGDHGSHGVLWTHMSFEGNIMIEFDYTRLDDIQSDVNIIYIQATGIGEGEYVHDIYEWNHLREIPYMRTYFQYMNLLHISYAAMGSSEWDRQQPDYVRARKYPLKPGENFNSYTELLPVYEDTGLFKPGVTYRFTIIKYNDQLYMQVKNEEMDEFFNWVTSKFPAVTEGRIGIRHMWARCSRYASIKVSKLKD